MKFLFLILLFSFSLVPFVNGQDSEGKFYLSGYGEMLYQHFNYGPNQKASINGSKNDSRALADIPRLVFEAKYNFFNDLFLEAEVEFEHLGTGSAVEIEYEEFGEYEFESEKGGEVQVEEFFIAKSFSDALKIRAGKFPIPFSLFDKKNKPLDYFATVFPESESKIIPSVWSEIGFELYGRLSNFNYRIALVNGLDASGFSSEQWAAGGYQIKFEKVSASNLASVARLDFTGIQNLLIGTSFYYGNSSDNRPKPEDMAGIDAHVSLFDLHLLYSGNPLIIRSDFIYGNLENSDIVSQRNARLSVNTQNSRSPVAKNAAAFYIESGFNIAPVFNMEHSYQLYPFIRYDYYNTMQKVEKGVFADPRFRRDIITAGINFIWKDQIIFKLDYSSRKVGKGNYNTENTIGLGIGFAASFIN